MAATKFRVSDIAKRMGKSEKDVLFQLQSLGAEISDANQILEPEVIQALISGKKLTTRTRSVIMREDKPQPEKAKKEAVRPPRPIVKPAPRAKAAEPPKEEAPATPAPPPVIIPEFIQAAEDEERAAKEAPPVAPSVAAGRVPAGEPAPTPAPRPAPRPMPARPAGPSGPRARAPQTARPNYAGQTPAVRPPSPRPSMSDRAPMAEIGRASCRERE